MSDAPRPPAPGERRLDRPPSDRYADPGTATRDASVGSAPGPASRGGPALAAGMGAVAGLSGALVTILLGGVLGTSAGLLVVAGATGWAIGAGYLLAGGAAVAPPRRRLIVLALAAASVVVGQAGLWQVALAEGGVLPLVDYLAATFGLLVPIQAALIVGVAWWTAR